MEIEDNIRLSDEVQDVFSKMPPWLVRYGSVFMALVVLSIIFSGFIIKYPATLNGNILITNETQPIPLKANIDGVVKIFVEDSSYVKKGQLLSYIENSTSIDSWNDLENCIKNLEQDIASGLRISSSRIPEIDNLGILQNIFNTFSTNCSELDRYRDFSRDSFLIKSILEQLNQTEAFKDNLLNEFDLVKEEQRIAENRFDRDKKLYEKKSISGVDYEQSEGKYLAKKRDLLETKSKIILCDEKISLLKKELTQEKRKKIDEAKMLVNKVKTSFFELKSNAEIFVRTYWQIAPSDGHVVFYDIWSENRYVNKGENIAFVSTSDSEIKGHLKLSGDGFSKVKKGQKVKISLDSYSITRYGYVYGQVESISEININNVYSVIVNLPNGLRTNYDFDLKFMPNLNGLGQVITDDLSIIERISEEATRELRKKINEN